MNQNSQHKPGTSIGSEEQPDGSGSHCCGWCWCGWIWGTGICIPWMGCTPWNDPTAMFFTMLWSLLLTGIVYIMPTVGAAHTDGFICNRPMHLVSGVRRHVHHFRQCFFFC